MKALPRIAGTAKNEAKIPYTEYTVRARELESLLLTWSTPLNTEGDDRAFVGRLRRDQSVEHGLVFWVVSDNLRKGAALNAIQIAQLVLARERLAAGAGAEGPPHGEVDVGGHVLHAAVHHRHADKVGQRKLLIAVCAS